METTDPTIQSGTPNEGAQFIEKKQQQMNTTNQKIDIDHFQKAHEKRIEAMRAQLHSPEPTEPKQNNPNAPSQEPHLQ